jgi:hypothetical protein
MGLLDDAIRDHLELKRRSGADPGEVARIENEALSAARREAPPAAAGGEDAADEVFDLEDDPLADLPYRDAEPDEDAADEPAVAEPAVQHREPEPEAVYEHVLADVEPEPEPEPSPAREAEEPEDDPQATQQFSLEELEAQAAREDAVPGQPRPRTPAADAPPAEAGEDDVLEETPDFLQETPEHDRLWFEQKPPKDFDF